MGNVELYMILLIVLVAMMVFPIFTLYARSKLKTLIYTACFVAALGILTGVGQGYRGDGMKPLLILFIGGNLVFIILTNAASLKKYRKEYGQKSFAPLLVSMIGIIAMMFSLGVGHNIRLQVFRGRIVEYESAVATLKNKFDGDKLLIRYNEMPRDYAHLGIYIDGYKYESGAFAIEFRWDRSSSFVYSSDGEPPKEPGSMKTKSSKKIAGNWFKTYY